VGDQAKENGGSVAQVNEAAGSILCVFAHPDDESFGVGGALAAYAARGVPVNLLCATQGQAGQLGDPPVTTPENLGAVREAAQLLGMREVMMLDYEDGQLRDVPYAPLLATVMDTYRRLRPAVVVCFGPNGISRHPDHIVTHRAATEASTAQLAALAKHAETQRDAREMSAVLQRMKPPVAPDDTVRDLLP